MPSAKLRFNCFTAACAVLACMCFRNVAKAQAPAPPDELTFACAPDSSCTLATFKPYEDALPLTVLHAQNGVGDPELFFKALVLDGQKVDMSMCSGPTSDTPGNPAAHLWGTLDTATATGAPGSKLYAKKGSMLMYSDGKSCSKPSYPGPALAITQYSSASITWYNQFPEYHPMDFAVESTHYSDEPYNPSPQNPLKVARQSKVMNNFGLDANGQHIHYRPCPDGKLPGTAECPKLPTGEKNQVPGVVHMHGLITNQASDGLPFYTLTNKYDGSSKFSSGQTSIPKVSNPPSMLFYHDHSMGFTRLNVYAGTAGVVVVKESKWAGKNLLLRPTRACGTLGRNPFLACGFPEFPDSPYDVPLAFQDKALMTDGTLGWPTNPCEPPTPVTDPFDTTVTRPTRWAPEFFGPHNLVNGRVSPYLNLWPAWWRFRLLNAANARTYNLNWELLSKCWKIATESGYVKLPVQMDTTSVKLLPAERVEILCDFTQVQVLTPPLEYEMTDLLLQDPIAGPASPHIMKFRFITKPAPATPSPKPNLSQYTLLSAVPNLAQAWPRQRPSNRITKHVMLAEQLDPDDCPKRLVVAQCSGAPSNDTTLNEHGLPQNCDPAMFADGSPLTCKEGAIEKWQFYNPSADTHPMHWHLNHVQCSYPGGSNEMKDTVPIPSHPTGSMTEATLTCYVPCGDAQNVLDGVIQYGTNSGIRCALGKDCTCTAKRLQYVFHCHILEHEEHDMMVRFQVLTKECPNPILTAAT